MNIMAFILSLSTDSSAHLTSSVCLLQFTHFMQRRMNRQNARLAAAADVVIDQADPLKFVIYHLPR